MIITHVESFAVEIPLKPERRMVSALGRHEQSRFLVVRLGTDVGLEGAGEATVMPRWSGETIWGAKALVDHVFAPLVMGCDPHDLQAISARLDAASVHNWFTKAAMEMACWDLQGKAAAKPVYELLGGACRPRQFRCRFSLGAYEPMRAAETAAERVAAGFTTIKVKVGGRSEEDLARVRAVRAAIGTHVDLMIDANGGWDAGTAIRCIHAMDDCHLVLVEQPTPPGDYGALALVRRKVRPPILADETCFDLVHAQEIVRHDCCDAISVYPGKNGGIAKARAIVELAAQYGIPCSIGSNLEWDIATAAMAHLVVATPNLQVENYPGDVLGPAFHEFSIVKRPLAINGPLVTAPDEPGLGVEVDWDIVRAHPCA